MGGDTSTKATPRTYPKLASGPVGQQIHNIYRDRLGQFTSHGQYEGQNLQKYVSNLDAAVYVLKHAFGCGNAAEPL